MEINEKVGQRIRELRTEQGLTQEAVAFKADVDRTFMNHVENGRRNISIATLQKIVCTGLEVSLQDFFNTDLFNGKRRGKK